MSGEIGLEKFVHDIRTLTTDGNFTEIASRINNFVHSLLGNGRHLDIVLETFGLHQHSLGILTVILTKLTILSTTESPSIDAFKIVLTQLQEFIDGFNEEQIRFAIPSYDKLFHMLKSLLLDFQIPMCGIDIFCRAIRKIQTSNSQLTSIHADLCQLCLVSKCFKPALEFLDVDITAMSSQSEEYTKHFLLYFYYGGMIYTALKDYDRALYFFEVCLTTPAMAVSHIILEAYKKYVLVSLILNGKVEFLPRFTSSAARFLKRLSQAYQELITAYGTNNCDEIQAIITKYEEPFNRDHNLGLVKQVLGSLYKKNIQRLTNTFLTLSLSDVASRVKLAGPAEAEKHILNMIEDGEIFATINQKDGMVIFHDDPEKYNSPRMLAKLEKEMATCVELCRKVLAMEEEVIVTPQYVRKACGQNDQDDQAACAPPINVTKAPSQHKHNTYSM